MNTVLNSVMEGKDSSSFDSTTPTSVSIPISTRTHSRLDKIGAGVSLTCAIHCILAPLIVGLLPMSSLAFAEHRGVEAVVIAVSFILGTTSLAIGYRLHRRGSIFILLAVSLGAMLLSRLFVGRTSEVVLLVTGACGVALCHLVNRKLCASCPDCSCPHEHP